VRDSPEECVNLVVLLQRVPQRVRAIDVIAVATTEPFSRDVSAGLEIVDDLHRRSLGDPNELGEVTDANIGGRSDNQQDMRVVGEEGP
jgi:hypothetical protein